jgi:beta-N-acetylhexosaminidase/D-alanyl-D-alanine dipeptidase
MPLKFGLALALVSAAACETKPATGPQAPIDRPVEPTAVVFDARPALSVDSDAGTEPSPNANDLVDLQSHLPKALLDMRYAGSNNFVGKAIYPKARCLVRRPVALALAEVQGSLHKQGLQLLFWDCYRPFSVQERFWKLVPDSRYVAKPIRKGSKLVKGSKHNRGAAVDISLASLAGEALLMPTDHDDFTSRAHVGATGVADAARKNAETLRQHMQSAGFTGIATKWWHFDHKSWRDYSLSDQPL